MPNAVKYSTTAQTNSIQKGAVGISVNGGTGPTGTTGWYNGITPTTGEYIVFETDSGFNPRIYAPQNNAELIRLANSKGAGGVSTVTGALEWFASQASYSAVNKSYPNIITDNLVYLIDSTFTPSYPTSGTTTYPIRDTATVGNGALQNGVGFNSSSGAFIFDGSDDQILPASSNNFQNINWSTGITIMVLYKIDAVTDFNSQFRAFLGVTGANRSFNFYLYGASNPATTLQYHFSSNYAGGVSNAITVTTGSYHLGVITCNSVSSTYYHDGVAVGTQTPATPSYTTAGGAQYFGRADNMWKGNIAKWMIYNKVLTQAEILQNYYQGNIVTDGLVYALDAGNLASYVSPSTTAYSLTGSFTGALINGTSYTSSNGGSWIFDGSNDYINCGTFSVSFLTVSTWVYKTTSTNEQGICRKENGWAISNYQGVLQVAPGTSWQFYNTGYTIPLNTWVNIVYTYSGTGAAGSQTVYINGVSIYSTSAGSGAISANGNQVNIGFDDNGWYWNGRIANTQIYNRALTAAEISQNFSAQSSRFLTL